MPELEERWGERRECRLGLSDGSVSARSDLFFNWGLDLS